MHIIDKTNMTTHIHFLYPDGIFFLVSLERELEREEEREKERSVFRDLTVLSRNISKRGLIKRRKNFHAGTTYHLASWR